jgi:3-oxoacyl-[acyl-carrier-protein] synthase III
MTAPALRAVIKGTGSALPKRIVTNAELAAQVETSDEWITERTGIKARHVAGPDDLGDRCGAAGSGCGGDDA